MFTHFARAPAFFFCYLVKLLKYVLDIELVYWNNEKHVFASSSGSDEGNDRVIYDPDRVCCLKCFKVRLSELGGR
jgi:hypothetical protein